MAPPTIGDMLAAAKQADPEHRDVPVVLARSVAQQLDALGERIESLQSEYDEQETRFIQEKAELAKDTRFSDPRPGELAEREAKTLGELREKIDARVAERDALLADAAITLRFFKLPGQDWARITSTSEARPGVTMDSLYGYNYHAVAKVAAAYVDEEKDGGRRYGARVIEEPAEGDAGGTTERLEHLEPEQWEDLWNLLSGGEFDRIALQIFDLNDYTPRRRAEAARKASRAGSASS